MLVSIREFVIQFLEANNMAPFHLANRAQINQGTLSRLLHGSKPIGFHQLTKITLAMGLQEDYFFDRFVEECVENPSIRRIRPFIQRCSELGRNDCIEKLVNNYLEDLGNISSMFLIAEDLFEQKQFQSAKVIYEKVSEAEKYQHSERLAQCRYRLFISALSTDIVTNYQAALVFEGYVNRLDERDQLDALKYLIEVFVSVHEWERVDKLALEMLRLGQILYNCLEDSSEKRNCNHPIYYYILYGWLYRSAVCEEREDYESALRFVTEYNCGEAWIRERDEAAQFQIQRFKDWGKANELLYRMLAGEKDALCEYAEYIAAHPNEIFYALSYIIRVANRFNYNVDDMLERFDPYIPFQNNSDYNNTIIAERYARFLADLGIYKSRNDKGASIIPILEGLRVSISIRSIHNIVNCMTLFERFRDWASDDQKTEFKKLSNEVHRTNAETKILGLV